MQQNESGDVVQQQRPKKKRSKVARGFGIFGVILLVIILIALTVNALLSMFMEDYYTTFGEYRLFSIVSDSMEPAIPKGSMIVGTKPKDVSEIKVSSSEDAKDGTVITFKAKNVNGESILLTHRVIGKSTDADGRTIFTTRGDNAGGADSIRPAWEDVVGIYTGKKVGFFGALFGFFASALGASVLIFVLFIVVVAWLTIYYINKTEARKALENAALKKSSEALSTVNLRYDNINEITAVLDVLGMVTEEPKSSAESKMIAERLNEFIRATTFELPQTPETAAILDSLPAPDTPGSLAAALSAGATLRQAEDGQTLILTTLSGGKNIILTPVNTPDGIILCQQGVRIKTDIAPNIEEIGLTSMPAAPEFFEGQPLEKNVEYPELPQPGVTLGPEALLSNEQAQAVSRQIPTVAELPSPQYEEQTAALPSAASAQPEVEQQPGQEKQKKQEKQEKPSQGQTKKTRKPLTEEQKEARRRKREEKKTQDMSREAYLKYREVTAERELKRAARLRELLVEASPLTPEEQLKVAEHKSQNPPKKRASKPLTPEQKAKRKAAAERRKQAQEDFLNTLTPEDRELYLTERKLAKSREKSIRNLKRIEADRKLLDKLD
ncbi:MAG: signal peptidase I [Clostridiales bacterium]|nr:signal peptidase I [Clostridiales bacterium]